MKIKSTACLLWALLLTTSLASAQVSEQDLKKAFASAFGYLNAESARNGVFITPGEYVMSEGKLVGQKYVNNSFATTYKGGNTGIATASMNVTGDKVYSVNLNDPACNSQGAPIESGDMVDFDAEGQPVKIVSRSPSMLGKNYMKRKYLLEYANGKLSKVTGTEIIYEGKSSKVKEEVLKFTTTYTWVDNSTLRADIDVIYGFNKKGKQLGDKSSTLYTYTDNSITVEKTTGDTYKSEFVKSGNEITYTYSTKYSSMKEIATLENDRVVKTERWEFNADKSFKDHILVTHTYVLKEPHFPKDNLCNYKTEDFTSWYNATGVVIRERKGQQGRERNPDGTWGEWFTYRM